MDQNKYLLSETDVPTIVSEYDFASYLKIECTVSWVYYIRRSKNVIFDVK